MTAADRPTVPHPDLDTLADLDAGVLDPAAAEDVAAHVGGCARCSAAMAAFDAVRADLHDLPPPAMPESVAARLDATLADLRSGAAGPPGAPVAAPATRSPAQELGLPPRTPPPPHLPQAGGPPRPPEPPRPVADLAAARQARERRRRSVTRTTGAVAAALVLVAAGASVAALVDSATDKGTVAGSAADTNDLPGKAPVPTNGVVPTESTRIPAYTKESLPGALESITSSSAVQVIEQLGETGPGGQMANAARRQACERTIPSPRGPLTAVRRIDFEGKPAYIFVFTDLADGRPNAFVVSMDCGTTGALSATVLDEVR